MGHYDVIVVGAGGTMGSSAMYHLARSGSKASRRGVKGGCGACTKRSR